MTLFEFNCRNLYYDYQEGRYNSAELIYFVCHTLKSYGFYHHEVKSLMNIIRNSVKEARWREDLDVYDEWSRHAYCCFLAQFDPSDFWKTEELVTVEGSPIIVDYRPVDVMNAINRQWNSIYNHPCLYPAVTHIIEASMSMTTPPDFNERIKRFIYRAGKLYDNEQGVKEDDFFNESA